MYYIVTSYLFEKVKVIVIGLLHASQSRASYDR